MSAKTTLQSIATSLVCAFEAEASAAESSNGSVTPTDLSACPGAGFSTLTPAGSLLERHQRSQNVR